MERLKSACLWVLTVQAWVETTAPLENRGDVPARVQRVLFWYNDALGKKWLRLAAEDQLRDWKSAWRVRGLGVPESLLQDVSFVGTALQGLSRLLENPRDAGLRQPAAVGAMRDLLTALGAYHAAALAAAAARGLVVPDDLETRQDELAIYFERLDARPAAVAL